MVARLRPGVDDATAGCGGARQHAVLHQQQGQGRDEGLAGAAAGHADGVVKALAGWDEEKITLRFWIVGALAALVGVAFYGATVGLLS